MTRTSRFILFTAIAAMTACTDELPMQSPAVPDEYIPGLEGYDFMIATEETYSRTVYTDHFHSEFSDKDRLGAFSLQYPKTGEELDITVPATGWRDGEPNRNAIYTVHVLSNLNPDGDATDTQRLQVLAGPEGDKALTIQKGGYLLYYPHDEAYNNVEFDRSATEPTTTNFANLAYSVKTDQRNDEDFEKSDLLWDVVTTENSYTGDKIEETGSNPIKVYMDHVMATIVVKIHKDSLDTDYGVRLLNLFDTAWGVDLTRNVHLADDAPKPDATSPTQLCDKGHQLRCKYTASDASGNTDDANRTASFNMHLESYRDDADKDMLVFRAAVPAYQTIAKDQEILDATLFNVVDQSSSIVEKVRTIFKSASDVKLLPGHNYIFTLRSRQLPAIKDVTDDESWVLDVFDPVTHEVVGLLCREYLRYQPGVGRTDAEFITGTPYNETKYVLSQAWVFYNLKEGYESEKIINLDHGTVLRFIYDLRTSNSGYTNHVCKGRWPLPHIGTDGGGGGMFTVAHGRVWDYDAQAYSTSSGYSSTRYQWKNGEYVENGHNDATTGELYMHGGTITWEKTSGVHPFDDKRELEYYHIGSFTMPEKKVTDYDALLYGHIAIDANGNVSVSYNPYNKDTKRELTDNTVKVAYTEPHKLNDIRGDEATAYPVVKIGYNNFWMSRSLHTKCLNDGTPLTDHYDTINKETASFDKIEKTAEDGTTYTDYPELEKGFLYPYRKAADAEFDSRNADTFDDYPLLYNFVAYSDEKFIPLDQSVDINGLTRFNVKIPDEEEIGAILNYFGIACASKLMSAAFRPAVENSYDKVYDLQQALLHKCYTDDGYNFYVANVSGFNLHAMGGFTGNSFNQDLGRQLSMWLLLPENERYTTTTVNGSTSTILNLALLRFDNYSAFSKEVNLDQIVHKVTQQPSGDYSQIPIRHAIFYPVRYFMRMKYQQNTGGTVSAVKSFLRKSPKPANNATNGSSKTIPISVNESTTMK